MVLMCISFFFSECKKPLDIAFVVDASGSVGSRSFQLVKRFLQEFTQYFNVSANETHFACLHYDHRVFKDFTFNDIEFYDLLTLQYKLGSMSYPSGATLTDRALWVAKTFYSTGNGARDYHSIPRCLVVLTDGRTYRGKDRLIPPVSSLKVHCNKHTNRLTTVITLQISKLYEPQIHKKSIK